MTVLVTCGPSYEPIDEVRRLTNFSTGELGVLLSEELARAGYAVRCLKGEQATFRDPEVPVVTERFSTNEDLWGRLQRLAASGVAAVFHAAALCDYRVARVEDGQARALAGAKLESRSGAVVLHLEPARKVLGGLRELFPAAWIVGWKYELEGDLQAALGKGWRQLQECRTDACVVNGRAAGPGFQVCEPAAGVTPCGTKAELAWWLATRLKRRG